MNNDALPDVSNIRQLELYADGGDPIATIENVEGSRLSLQIYYQAAIDFGGIGPTAAEQALQRYGEHADEAREHPGRHPNIDRLFEILASGEHYAIRARHA